MIQEHKPRFDFSLSLSLVLALVSAWILQTKPYFMVADDFPFYQSLQKLGIVNIITQAYQATGIRRSFAFLSNIPILGLPPACIGFFCLALHIICTLLLFQVTRITSQSRLLGFLTAIIFGVFPFGYGAVTWASGTYIITHFIFFLLAFWLLLEHSINPKLPDVAISVMSGISLFLSCLIGEHLVLAVPFVGIGALLNSKQGVKSSYFKKSWVITPIITFLIYIVLVFLTQPAGFTLTDVRGNTSTASNINLLTIFSVWFYQIRNLDYFQPWLSPNIINITFGEIGFFRLLLAFILLSLSIYFFLSESRIFLSKDKSISVDNSYQQTSNGLPVIGIIILMMLGLSSVHALAGGYSASSRHQYIPIAMSLILISTIARYTGILNFRISFFITKYFAVFLIAFGISTTWLVSSINHFETQRHYQAVEALFQNSSKLEMPVKIEYNPPLYFLWPNMERTLSHSFDQEWVINLHLRFLNVDSISLSHQNPAQIVKLAYEDTNLIGFTTIQSLRSE